MVYLRRCGGLARRCGGLVVSVPASRSPVHGSNLGRGLTPQSGLQGRQIALQYSTNNANYFQKLFNFVQQSARLLV